MTKPVINFVCIGPTRTATTWLSDCLSDVLSIPGPHLKETYYFDQNYKRGRAWFESHLSHQADAPIGEFAPTYFHSVNARQRIKADAQTCKIISIMRDPVERLYSLYKLRLAYGSMRWSFEEAVYNDLEMFSSSRYAFHLAGWQTLFGAENLQVLIYDDLERNPIGCLDEICKFLGVEADASILIKGEHPNTTLGRGLPIAPRLTYKGARLAFQLRAMKLSRIMKVAKRLHLPGLLLGRGGNFPPPDATVLSRLREVFIPEVEALERMLGRDLNSWKHRNYAAMSEVGFDKRFQRSCTVESSKEKDLSASG
jgi:sulfotransferase family protein